MKRYIYSTLALFAAASATYAVDFTTSSGSGNVLFTPAENTDYDIYYNGPKADTSGDVKARVGGTKVSQTQYTPSSVTFKQGDGTTTWAANYWNLLVNWNFDTKDLAEGEKIVLKNESSTYVQLQYGEITIQNSDANSKSVAVIDAGTSYYYIRGNASDQTPDLYIKTDTKLTGTRKDYSLYLGGASTLQVSNNATLSLEGNVIANGDTSRNAVVKIDAGSAIKLVNGKTLTFNKTSALENNGAIIGSGTLTISNGNTFDMAGEINLTSYINPTTGKSIKSKLVIDSGTKLSALNNNLYADDISIDGTGTELTINDANRSNGATYLTNGAVFNVLGMLTSGQGQLISIKSGSQMIVNKTNAGVRSLNNLVIDGANSLLHIKGDVNSNRHATITNNGVLKIEGQYKLSNNSNQTDFTNASRTELTIATGGKVIADSLLLATSRLNLQTENAITNANGEAIDLTVDSTTKLSILMMSASQKFNTITANKQNLQVEILDDAILSASFVSENGGKIFINGFAEETIFVENADQIADVNSIFFAYATADDAETEIDQLYINNGWLSAIAPAIPEPAEWAMIFGGIALSLAIYRRRK